MSGIPLDCHDLESALMSLADALDTDGQELREALTAYDESRFDGTEDPLVQMPREVLNSLGRDLPSVRPAGAYFFHGTRVTDPDEFRRRGILPLDQMVDPIWTTLSDLVRDVCTPDEWDQFRRSIAFGQSGGHDGYLYRLKTGGAIHHGPFAELVREIFLTPAETGSHDYLACAEIVQDIAFCFSDARGVNLEERFFAASTPVIVKFWSAEARPRVVEAALWYTFWAVRGEQLGRYACYGFSGEGQAVSPKDIVAVETRV